MNDLEWLRHEAQLGIEAAAACLHVSALYLLVWEQQADVPRNIREAVRAVYWQNAKPESEAPGEPEYVAGLTEREVGGSG